LQFGLGLLNVCLQDLTDVAKPPGSVVVGMPWVNRAGAERFWSLCAPSAAKLESAGVVLMITVMTVITAAAPIRTNAPTVYNRSECTSHAFPFYCW
jgi:hypothetical protein